MLYPRSFDIFLTDKPTVKSSSILSLCKSNFDFCIVPFGFPKAIPFNFLGVYVSYLLVLKQLDVKNKLADKICVAFSSKNGCNAALESSVSKLFGILL